jgi:hypothetical protein
MDSESHNSTKKPFHQAARDYDNTPKLFRRLMPFKDGIVELRQKRASYATIAELLTDEGIVVSRNTVARFCRRFLVSASRSKGRKESAEPISSAAQPVRLAIVPENQAVSAQLEERRAKLIGPWTRRRRGPRIADARNL